MHLASTRTAERSKSWQGIRPIVVAATVVCAASMLVFGLWAFAAPVSFADFIDYQPYNRHLTHYTGAFQIGIGVTLLIGLVWDDGLAIALTGFVVASGLHTLSHELDRHIGGHDLDVPTLGLLTIIGLVGLFARMQRMKP
jgi:hypothetical protein